MKWIMVLIMALLVMVVSIPQLFAAPPGPIMVDAHFVTWDPNTEADLSGYYLWWRPVTTPVTPWDSVRRTTVPKTTPIKYDLLSVISVNGNYEIAASAYDTGGNESGLSNIVPFVLDLPATPKNSRIIQ